MIRDDFDKCVMYSMIKVENSDRTRYEPGIAILKKIVLKRMDGGLIAEEALDYMVMKSGGAIRDLFFMLSELLKTLSVIEYNGERWCGVHPVLIDFLREKGDI